MYTSISGDVRLHPDRPDPQRQVRREQGEDREVPDVAAAQGDRRRRADDHHRGEQERRTPARHGVERPGRRPLQHRPELPDQRHHQHRRQDPAEHGLERAVGRQHDRQQHGGDRDRQPGRTQRACRSRPPTCTAAPSATAPTRGQEGREPRVGSHSRGASLRDRESSSTKRTFGVQSATTKIW